MEFLPATPTGQGKGLYLHVPVEDQRSEGRGRGLMGNGTFMLSQFLIFVMRQILERGSKSLSRKAVLQGNMAERRNL